MSNWQKDRIVALNWASLTLGERIRHLEVEGYLVLPDLLSSAQLRHLKTESAKLETQQGEYSIHQRVRYDLQFAGGAITELIAHPPTIAFLKELLGEQIMMMTYYYTRSEPGYPGASLHCDGQPWGSVTFGYEESCPRFVRVLYYLDDLMPEVSPFRVVPRSHLTLHADGNPYLRYEEHPEQMMVTVKAGSVILLHYATFHGTYPNTSSHARELLAITYRPAWAGPISEVQPWAPAELAKLPAAVRQLMGDPNTRIWFPEAGHRPLGMKKEAPGINPSRWERSE